jgi:cyclic beta-1,2-glucan synthetase
VRHGWGYTVFTHHSHGLRQTLRLYAAPDAPVKVIALHLHNDEPRGRRLTATYFAEWVLGAQRDVQAPHLTPDYDGARGALLVRNPWAADVPAQVAFLASTHAPHGVTADRVEFLGRRGDLSRPEALRRVGLRGNVDPGGDLCAALQVHVDLPAGGGQDLAFVLGAGTDAAEAERLLDAYRDPGRLETVWNAARASWRTVLGAVTVQTPDPALDTLLNGWLLYQTLSCRVWGRSALYQSSGAYGFRDQLQDVLALLHAAPELARAQILLAAAHQFTQGDVLHWWHPPLSRGVRTRISDDLLWLPYVACGYVEATGDAAILDEPVAFLSADELGPQEHERYDTFGPGPTAPLYEHLLRAVRRAGTSGPHGLPLMGGGDWNDGMNLVGAGGQGESVWLGWFLHTVLTRMIPICRARGDVASAAHFYARAGQLRANLEAHAWDGGWYLRAFYDDGTPLGSAQNRECRIDALAQSWAVLSGAADPARARTAMEAVDRYLVRGDDGLILLLTPPFDRSRHHPGYIQGYPPGIRENGGQYSHAAVWTAWAFAALGDAGRAHRLFGLLNPITHTRTPQGVGRFQTEPYVMPADVSSNPQHVGMGGWSWYTGSAAWMYRLGLEGLLGVTRHGPALHVRPCIPDDWPEYRVIYRYGRSKYALHVTNMRAGRPPHRRLDGRPLGENGVPLVDDGQLHWVEIQL